MSLIVAASALAVAMSLTGCSSDETATSSSEGSCPAELLMGGHTYVQHQHTGIELGSDLDRARFTDCDDGGGAQRGAVPARALEGVDPGTAFAAKLGDEWQLYVATSADACSVRYASC